MYIPGNILCDIHSCTRRWACCPRPRHPPHQGSLVEEEEESSEGVWWECKWWEMTNGKHTHEQFVFHLSSRMTQKHTGPETICYSIKECIQDVFPTHWWTEIHHGRPRRNGAMCSRMSASFLKKKPKNNSTIFNKTSQIFKIKLKHSTSVVPKNWGGTPSGHGLIARSI